MAKSKIETFIGFSIKSGNIALGSGAIDVLKSGVYLLILNADCAKNSMKLALKFQRRFNCPLLMCLNGFENAVNREGCKIAAIRDRSLAEAVLNCKDNNYQLYAGGN